MDKINYLDKILEEIDLKTKIKVLNKIAFINLLTELGYREDKYWIPDEDETFYKLMKQVEKHTNDIMKEIQEHNNG